MLLPVLAAVACGPGSVHGPASALGAEADASAGSLAGDAATGIPPEPTPLDLALAAYDAGRLDEAAGAATDALAAPGDGETADSARLVLARVAVAEGRWEEAQARLAEVGGGQAKYVPGYSELVDLLSSEADGTLAAAGEDERRAAARRLEGLTLLPGDSLIEAIRLELQIRLDRALGMREALVRHVAEILPLCEPAEARRWQDEAAAVLDDPSALTELEIQSLMASVDAASPLWPAVARRRAETAIAAGDLVAAASILDRVDATRPGETWVRGLRERIAETANVDAGRIGVLVPTSGSAAAIGERVLAAVEIALAPYGDRFVIEARDTGGDEATTREAVQELVDDSRAIAIVGPVEARVAQAAAEEAAALGVPLISLNGQRDVGDAASCLFRDYPTFGAEIAALVDYAWGHARGHRFAVLRGEGHYGELIAQAVGEEVGRRGGEMIDVPSYTSAQTEFLELAQAVRRARPDVIVFADSAARVALIAPALAYEDLWPQPAPHDGASPTPGGPRREALYLLPSAAADPAALGEAKRYVEGAVAAVGFVPAATAAERSAFETAFDARYPSGPSALDAFAHDAARIAATLIDLGATNRPALCRALGTVESADTAAPFSGFGADGEARHPVRTAVVHDGRPVPVEGAP
ncbi:MAG: ABC transporter substrate-binding protein [Deltaproteobacteria bacterium]|nr:ABC transporter substrate-binding protein [Deltaproteobacteria bacterium]